MEPDLFTVTIHLTIDRARVRNTEWRTEGLTVASSHEDKALVFSALDAILQQCRAMAPEAEATPTVH